MWLQINPLLSNCTDLMIMLHQFVVLLVHPLCLCVWVHSDFQKCNWAAIVVLWYKLVCVDRIVRKGSSETTSTQFQLLVFPPGLDSSQSPRSYFKRRMNYTEKMCSFHSSARRQWIWFIRFLPTSRIVDWKWSRLRRSLQDKHSWLLYKAKHVKYLK